MRRHAARRTRAFDSLAHPALGQRRPARAGNYGYAGAAGVLQLHSPASARALSGSVSATVGNHSLRAGSTSLGTTAARNTSVVATLSGLSRDGYVFNRQLGEDVDHHDTRSALLRVETHPSSTAPLTLALTVHATRSRDGEQPLVPLDGAFYEVERATAGFTNHEALNAGLSASLDTTHGRLSATASLNRWDLGPYRSVLAFGPMELLNDASLSRRNHSAELRFVSPADANAGWSVTGFASRAETNGSFARAFSGFTFEQSSYEITDRPLALSADSWQRFALSWKLTAGLRAERNGQTFLRREQIPTTQTYTLTSDDSAFLPRGELSHELNPHTTWSLSAAVGHKPGGYSAFTGNRALAAFGPERTRALETGLTRTFPFQRLRTTVRAYV